MQNKAESGTYLNTIMEYIARRRKLQRAIRKDSRLPPARK